MRTSRKKGKPSKRKENKIEQEIIFVVGFAFGW